jgi:hypothetical protein
VRERERERVRGGREREREPLGLKGLVWSYTDCYIIMKKYHSFNISTAVDYCTDYFN